jgi:hypothetical protein
MPSLAVTVEPDAPIPAAARLMDQHQPRQLRVAAEN